MLKTLGSKVTKFQGFETFEAPVGLTTVVLTSDEITAVCPVTGQPDWYGLEVEYSPRGLCVESKTFKLYVQSFRNEGMFCEALAARIARDLGEVLKTGVTVTLLQKPRGGVGIQAEAFHNGAIAKGEDR